MTQQTLNRNQRKAMRIAATVGATIIPNHVQIPRFPLRMFGSVLEEEHLVYPKMPTQVYQLRFTAEPLRMEEEPRMTCELCGEEVELFPFMQNDLKARIRVCHTCKTTKISKCNKCGMETTSVTLVTMKNGKVGAVCNECRGSYFSACDICGAIVYDGLHASINDMSVCPSCEKAYKKKNMYCLRCGNWVPVESKMMATDGTPVCMTCYSKELTASMTVGKPMKKCIGYTSTGGHVFFTTYPAKILFLGVEVELTNGKYPDDYDRIDPSFAIELMAFQEADRKSDGSVSLGHEIATQAMELGYHQRFFKWEALMKLHVKHNFDGHDSPKAGLHIHGSRAFFGEKKTKTQDLKIGKLLFMLDRKDWRSQWEKFSRRDNKAVRAAGISDPWGYCRFYNIDWNNRTIVEGLEKAMSLNFHDRNYVLNFYNQHASPIKLLKTVEWRGLKSHTNHRVILAGIEMMDLLCRIAESKIKEDAIRAMTWKQLCKKIPNTSVNLVWYLQSKRLWER